MMTLYNKTCQECSQLITNRYSTSFSLGIKVFDKKFRAPIYAVYGFVRFADEIVDTFHDYPKATLLERFRQDTYRAIEERISLNPVLQSFQEVVHKYKIEMDLIDAFLDSMEMDLFFHRYEDSLYKKYIYGSAEVVGLMCLRVFCEGNDAQYESLKEPARSLGSAFQKINFLRDMKSDFDERGRVYFPGVDFTKFTNDEKIMIEADIKKDFDDAYKGIIRLPKGARFGVYLAYVYYINLFQKIKNAPVTRVQQERIRVNDRKKVYLLFQSALRNGLNLLQLILKTLNIAGRQDMGKAERWFVYILVYLFLSGLVAHLVPRIYPFTRYTTDLFLLLINGALLYFLFGKNKDQKLWWWAAITYLGTFSLEALGVATGKIFGEYHYGQTMFLQVLDVPLVIALNWTVLILAVNNLMCRWTQHPVLLALLCGIFIAIYDYFIEPVAIRLDYWQWEGGVIPLQNYLAWAIIAFVFSLPLHLWKIRFHSPLLNIYLFVQLIYFILLNLLL